MVSERTIGRLSLYRRLLADLIADGVENTFSHQLAAMAGRTAAQVRRDIMAIGYTGSPSHGYTVADLATSIGHFLDSASVQKAALVGLGNLGRAVLAFFASRRPNLAIAAAFDSDPQKVKCPYHGCPCHRTDQLKSVVAAEGIRVGVIAVPADQAQIVAEDLVGAGVCGVLNFAPVPLQLDRDIFVEQIDITTSLEKVAYFARCGHG